MTPNETGSLEGKVALVTGLSRRSGIGHAIVTRLLADGACVFGTGWSNHDAEMPWGVDPINYEEFGTDRFSYSEVDLADPSAPAGLVDQAIAKFGALDIVVANHARSSAGNLAEVTVKELDVCWAVNVRATVMLAQTFLARYDSTRDSGRFVMFTSGQHLQAMDGEIAYAVSKGAIHQMTQSISNALISSGITVNTINPGPVDTGYATGVAHEQIAEAFPAKRWGQPEDVARLAAWLVGPEAGWITGQVINSEGGFRRWVN